MEEEQKENSQLDEYFLFRLRNLDKYFKIYKDTYAKSFDFLTNTEKEMSLYVLESTLILRATHMNMSAAWEKYREKAFPQKEITDVPKAFEDAFDDESKPKS